MLRQMLRRAMVLVTAGAALACLEGDASPSRVSQGLAEVYNGAFASARYGASAAGCGPSAFIGQPGRNTVIPLTGTPFTLPPSRGFGFAVACASDGDFLVASAVDSGFVWAGERFPDGGMRDWALDASVVTLPGLSLATQRFGSSYLIAAGAPQHGCSPSCNGALLTWVFVPSLMQPIAQATAFDGTAGEALGTGVAIGRFSDGGNAIGVVGPGAAGPQFFDVYSGTLSRVVQGETGMTSIAFGRFPSHQNTFVVGRPRASEAVILSPAANYARGTTIVCNVDSGVGEVLTAFDWDGDGFSDLVMSNPATNDVEVALSRDGYTCSRLPVPALSAGSSLAGFGHALASVGLPDGGSRLLVGAPSSTLNLLPFSGAAVLFELCDVPSQAARCLDGGAPSRDGGSGDAGVRDGGADGGNAFDAGGIDAGEIDAGEIDAGVIDAGVAFDAGSPDAGTETDAGGPADSGTPADAGVPPDAGLAADGGAGGGSPGALAFRPVSCGCQGGGDSLVVSLALLLLRVRRRPTSTK